MPVRRSPAADRARRLVERWLDAFNCRDWDAYGACFADDVRYRLPRRDEPFVGRAAHVEHDRAHAGDGRLSAEHVYVCGDVVVVEGSFTTPERHSRWVTVLELREGRIAHERLYY